MSFDQHMRHLNTNSIFRAKVYMLSNESPLWGFGVKVNDIVYCQSIVIGFTTLVNVLLMQSDGTIKQLIVNDNTSTHVEWLVYDGMCKHGELPWQQQQ